MIFVSSIFILRVKIALKKQIEIGLFHSPCQFSISLFFLLMWTPPENKHSYRGQRSHDWQILFSSLGGWKNEWGGSAIYHVTTKELGHSILIHLWSRFIVIIICRFVGSVGFGWVLKFTTMFRNVHARVTNSSSILLYKFVLIWRSRFFVALVNSPNETLGTPQLAFG